MTAQIYKTDYLPGQEQKQELFIRQLEKILKEKRTEAVLAAMDIQNFKSVNEIWGMSNGSRLLSIIIDQSLKFLGQWREYFSLFMIVFICCCWDR